MNSSSIHRIVAGVAVVAFALLPAACSEPPPPAPPKAPEPRSETPKTVARTPVPAAVRFADNGDGTVTDRATGLIWEKKCAGCEGLHDVDAAYYWSADGKAETVWDWIDKLNQEGDRGFAGRRNWRLPNVKELLSLVRYDRVEPSVSLSLARDACEAGCADLHDPNCSCTYSGAYWSATTFNDFPAHAYAVGFRIGTVDDRMKTIALRVRAVHDPEIGP